MTIQPIKSTLLHKVAPMSTATSGVYPALILLHGRGANEDDLLGLASYLDPRFLIISVRAPFEFPFGGYTWYDLHEVGAPELRQFNESYQRLSQFIEDVRQQYPVDPAQIFLLGFSMGSVMAYALSLTKPEMVKGIVAHSGYVPENTPLKFQWSKLAGLSFFVAHGTHDPVIGVDFGRRAQQLLSTTEADLTYKEYPIGHQVSEESLTDFSTWLQKRL